MTRFSVKDLREFVRRGVVTQDAADEVIADLNAAKRETVEKARKLYADEYPPSRLAGPVEFMVPSEVLTENAYRAMQPIYRGRLLKRDRATLRNAWLLHFRDSRPALPVTVTFTRIGRRMDSHDSLAASFKHLTDEVTELLGLRNDDTTDVTWVYQQEPQHRSAHCFRLKVEAHDEA